MRLTFPQKQILYSLGQFYDALNQPLVEMPVRLQTSKITFIELLLQSGLMSKHERALYKNLETLQKKKLIAYQNKMIKCSEAGLKELQKIKKEADFFEQMKQYFQQSKKPRRKLQTTLG